MTPSPVSRRPRSGFTLIEMSLVILVLLAMIGLGTISARALIDWNAGRDASETLRAVYAAQRTYLSDHPTAAVADLNANLLRPYLPGSPAAFPTVTSLEGDELDIQVSVYPPVVRNGEAGVYDPSGKANDSLWDVGE